MSQTIRDPTPTAAPTPAQALPSDDPHASADALAAEVKADIAAERAKALELGDRIRRLEAEVLPTRPQPDSPGQMIGD